MFRSSPPGAPSPMTHVGVEGLFDWPADCRVLHAWLNHAQIHFPTSWIFPLGFLPSNFRHRWSLISASHWLLTHSSQPEIVEMSSANINITRLGRVLFLRGMGKNRNVHHIFVSESLLVDLFELDRLGFRLYLTNYFLELFDSTKFIVNTGFFGSISFFFFCIIWPRVRLIKIYE